MLFLKFGLFTCAFYVALTLLFEVGVWALIQSKGLMLFVDKEHPATSLAIIPGILFGAMWLVSFCAAWFFVYRDLKPFFASL
jgi:hypothetical protein